MPAVKRSRQPPSTPSHSEPYLLTSRTNHQSHPQHPTARYSSAANHKPPHRNRRGHDDPTLQKRSRHTIDQQPLTHLSCLPRHAGQSHNLLRFNRLCGTALHTLAPHLTPTTSHIPSTQPPDTPQHPTTRQILVTQPPDTPQQPTTRHITGTGEDTTTPHCKSVPAIPLTNNHLRICPAFLAMQDNRTTSLGSTDYAERPCTP